MSDDDLDGLVKRVDPDRWLSSRFIADPQARADVVAIYAYDHELGRAPKVASNPLLGEIRLTWWREALDEIYEARAVRRHPGAEALAAAVARHQLPREPLEAMIDARYGELDPEPFTVHDAIAWARDTGGRAADLALRILDPASTASASAAGAAWALSRHLKADSALSGAFHDLMQEARRDVRLLSAAGFPAVAHAALAEDRAHSRDSGELKRRLKLTWAVARGRI